MSQRHSLGRARLSVAAAVALGAALAFHPTHAAAPVMESSAFQDGHADRLTWEKWFGGLAGVYRAGAEFWANHRSDPRSPACSSTSDVAFRSGCEEAQRRLEPSDRRRRSEAEYKAGWNSPADSGGTAATEAAPPASPRNRRDPDPPVAQKSAAPVPEPTGRTTAVPAASQSKPTRYICQSTRNPLPPIHLSVDREDKVFVAQLTTPSGLLTCTLLFVNGIRKPVYQSETAEACALLAGGNAPMQQTVSIVDDRLTATGVRSDNSLEYTFNMRTGLFVDRYGPVSARCEEE